MNYPSTKIKAKIERIFFQYSREGYFSPSIGMSHTDSQSTIPSYFYITSWCKDIVFPEEIGIDDILDIDVEEQVNQKTYRCLSAKTISHGPGPKHLSFPVSCPACGGLVLVSSEHPEIRACLSRSCPAQIRNVIIEFLASTGTRLSPIALKVLHQLIGSREIRSISDVYTITDDRMRQHGCTPAEAKEYLECLKLSRGKVSFEQILRGIGVFGINNTEIESLQKEMHLRNITLASWNNILNSKDLPEDVEIIIKKFRTYFLAIDDNAHMLQEVCRALD